MAWDDGNWDGLVSDLYLSALDREAGERLPGRLAALTEGVVASMWQLRPRDLALVGTPLSNVPREAVAAYEAHYHRHDPWGAAVQKAPFNVVLRGAEIVDEATLMRSVYYNEFAYQFGMFHVVGLQVRLGGTVGVVSILRAREAGPFEADPVAALDRALPHVASAFWLRTQIDGAATSLRETALDAALEGLGMPALVLDGHGAVVRANAAAEGIGCVRRALARRVNPHGVLSLPGGPDHERLEALVAGAARGEAGGAFRLLDEGRCYLATVAPLPGRLAELTGSSGRVLLLLRPLLPDRPGLPALATGLFGLTRAEAEAAVALVEGLSPAEIAAARKVKVSTVRTLLQRAAEKTDSRNLRDLVRVLMSLG